MDISRGVRMARASAGITSLSKMAAATGLSRNYLWLLQTGRRGDPGIKVLEALASGCGVKLSDLIRWAEGEA
jgi:transcriptional regulator with XRE-family HTH domain